MFHLSGFTDVFDVDYFIQQLNGFIEVAIELPPEIASKQPYRVNCSKRKGHFDYIESVLPSLLEHRFISITPAMSQRRDRYHLVIHCHFIVIIIVIMNKVSLFCGWTNVATFWDQMSGSSFWFWIWREVGNWLTE